MAKKLTIKEDWQMDIAERDFIDSACLISNIANRLYPHILMAADREQALMQDGGELMARLARQCAADMALCQSAMHEYDASLKEQAA